MLPVPVDLAKYGWNETLIHSLDSRVFSGLVGLVPSSMFVVNEATRVRDKYLSDEYEKMMAAYRQRNSENIFIEPQEDAGRWAAWGVGVSSVLIGVAVLAALAYLRR